jgi:three-Cys-motif partner protein
MEDLKYDKIGCWSEVKLAIFKDYADAYTKILSKREYLSFIYIDAFAGLGKHKAKKTGMIIDGSPVNALNIANPFNEYHFIDLDNQKVEELEKLKKERNNVFVYHEDCNKILPEIISSRAKYSEYKRALCILDPYGLHLNWELIQTAGRMKSIEIFLNFPVMDINMNVLKHNRNKVNSSQKDRMTAFWGDDSWENDCYTQEKQIRLFDDDKQKKVRNDALESAFRERLKKVAGFKYVPEPMPMKNSTNALLYYLYFATQNETGEKIAKHIFKKYSQRR